MIKLIRVMILCVVLSFLPLNSQTGTRQVPVFPEMHQSLVFLEGEDAVSTNFNTVANLNYSASGSKTLQLNSTVGLSPGSLYFSEWVFHIEKAGTYNFWYGGTPPGPGEDIYPSYFSPFRINLDGLVIKECYSEAVEIGETYIPNYFWVNPGEMWLAEGTHRIRFEIIAPRRIDGRYYFYIDNLFFLNSELEDLSTFTETVPEIFPDSISDYEITAPFQSVSHYTSLLETAPDDISVSLDLARIYTYLGDHAGALRILQKALPFDIENQEILKLAARNRIWKGDFAQALSVYKQALDLDPDQLNLWVEAGKVAGWGGQFDLGIDFFTRALALFPDSLNLKVNLALVNYWKSNTAEADGILTDALSDAEKDPAKLLELGVLLSTNGYPEKAIDILHRGRELFPTYLEFYLSEIDIYMENRDLGNPDDIYSLIEVSFIISPELSRIVTLYRERQGMRQMIIDDYSRSIQADPGNLLLREALVQTFFWNGMKKEAIREYKNILVNNSYHNFTSFEEESLSLLQLIDTLYMAEPSLSPYLPRAMELRNRIRNSRTAFNSIQNAAGRKPEDDLLTQELESKKELFSAVLAESQLFLDDFNYLDSIISVWKEEGAQISLDEEEEGKRFSLLTRDLTWEWDVDFHIREFEDVSAWEGELSPWLLAKVYQYAGNSLEAEKNYFKAIGGIGESQALFGVYETYLWNGEKEKRTVFYKEFKDEIDGYSGYTDFIEGLADDLASIPHESAGLFFGELEDADQVLREIQQIPVTIEKRRIQIDELIHELRIILNNRFARSSFFLTQQTSSLRFRLGDYFLEMGDNPGASRQFEQVLLVDPWNITATYKLGIVRQRYQDWSGAMKNYQKVFYQNPDYENAVAYYNQLGRQHPDTMDFDFVTELDNSVLSFGGEGYYKNEINTFLEFNIDFNFRVEQIYRTFGGTSTSSYFLQEYMVRLPLKLPRLGLEFVPSVGGVLWSTYFGQRILYPNEYDVPLSDFFDSLESEPEFSLTAGWAGGPFSVKAGYDWFIKQETLHRSRDLQTGARFSGEFSSYFIFTDIDWLSMTSTRTYGQMEFLGDGNTIGQIVQDIWIGFPLDIVPGFQLSLNGGVNYENSSHDSGGDYYAPSRVFEAKGGLRGTFNFHSDDYSRILELGLWGSAGGFWEEISSEREFALKTEGQISLYYSGNSNSSLYSTLYGSGSFRDGNFSDNKYWQFALSLGMKARMPSLLTD